MTPHESLLLTFELHMHNPTPLNHQSPSSKTPILQLEGALLAKGFFSIITLYNGIPHYVRL